MMLETSHLQTGLGDATSINDRSRGTDIPICDDHNFIDDNDEDDALKRSGPRNLDRTGYDEGKCRNVLVRYCAHIPRNYQYKDGIPQVFLILREHLGDENLDLAGGVLYELIEVDCEHTDDPGAAFQRWKHDHLRRYADLELPHVPHMTTITSSIIPTERLSQWRSKYPERYPFVLSDSSPAERSSVDPSCIRHRKAWLIDHTLYTSSRSDGTRPLNSPDPKKFHEIQWNYEYGTRGKFIQERDVSIVSPDSPSLVSPPGAVDTSVDISSQLKGSRRSMPGLGILEKLTGRIFSLRRKSSLEPKRRSWLPNTLMVETAALFRDKGSSSEVVSVPLPGGCRIPNAIFARKYSLVETSDSLPPYLSLRQMPTAESKATETIVEAASNGLLDGAPPWSFRGPFTPQLGFDGGLDYHWTPQEPTITRRRFDVGASTQDAMDLPLGDRYQGLGSSRTANYTTQRASTKRQGVIFNLDLVGGAANAETTQQSANYTTSNVSIPGNPCETTPRVLRPTIYQPSRPDGSSIAGTQQNMIRLASSQTERLTMERHRPGLLRPNPLLFQNIEFSIPFEASGLETASSNRKTTVIERLPSPPLSNVNVSRNDGVCSAADVIPSART
ncbi:hypothetical protein GGR53DRAFT_183189 [Hypoxylon sp. FL1150]|nr:hypothetical protein GGR53DRAFT_183189 [Hypoxylon sp. FL1150]